MKKKRCYPEFYLWSDYAPLIAGLAKKWTLFLGCSGSRQTLLKAAPYLKGAKTVSGHLMGFCSDEIIVVLCRSEKQAMDLFDQTVGDEGPTKKNRYNGPGRVYAAVFTPEGDCFTENT